MLIVLYLLGAIVLLFGFVVFIGAPYVPTRTQDVPHIFEQIALPKHAKVVDLGAGDGKLLVFAAQKGYQVVGYEINPILWLICKWRLRAYTNADVLLKSFWQADMSQADMVYTFLVSKYMNKLEDKLTKEMPPGSWLVSNVFELNYKKPHHTCHSMYYYQF